MRIEKNYSLKEHNSFRLPVKTRWFMEYESEEELRRILQDEYFQECLSLHIGEGSNLLFINDFDGVILHSAIKGIEVVEETAECVLLRVGAAEHWDDVVAYAVSKGWGGIENLSHIPGETGAAAVQNIGAYGVEIKDVIVSVEAYNQLTIKKKIFSNEECEYGYRDSFFKKKDCDPYILTYVNMRLKKNPEYQLNYGNLETVLKDKTLSLQTIRDAVISLRSSKLPDTEELGSAGSFFMNPIIPEEQFREIQACYPEVPSYPATEGHQKIPAGWLIEQCGFKGRRKENVGVYEKQALVIVNYGEASGNEIAMFAEEVSGAVNDKFAIRLVPEVKYIQ